MKIGILYASVFLCGAVGFMVLISAKPDPEHLILGEWNEVRWEYERVNLTDNKGAALRNMPDDVKRSIGETLVIHEAESWVFLPDGRLQLTSCETDKEVTWCMKGRGHILQIKYANNTTENYVVDKLDDGTLWLQFATDIQARGIAKLIFERK